MTPEEAKVNADVLKAELNGILELIPNEENEILKDSLKAKAIALQKGIKLFEVLGE